MGTLGRLLRKSPMKPYCFVLMPFGKKPDERGRLIDFDKVYAEIIKRG